RRSVLGQPLDSPRGVSHGSRHHLDSARLAGDAGRRVLHHEVRPVRPPLALRTSSVSEITTDKDARTRPQVADQVRPPSCVTSSGLEPGSPAKPSRGVGKSTQLPRPGSAPRCRHVAPRSRLTIASVSVTTTRSRSFKTVAASAPPGLTPSPDHVAPPS